MNKWNGLWTACTLSFVQVMAFGKPWKGMERLRMKWDLRNNLTEHFQVLNA